MRARTHTLGASHLPYGMSHECQQKRAKEVSGRFICGCVCSASWKGEADSHWAGSSGWNWFLFFFFLFFLVRCIGNKGERRKGAFHLFFHRQTHWLQWRVMRRGPDWSTMGTHLMECRAMQLRLHHQIVFVLMNNDDIIVVSPFCQRRWYDFQHRGVILVNFSPRCWTDQGMINQNGFCFGFFFSRRLCQ